MLRLQVSHGMSADAGAIPCREQVEPLDDAMCEVFGCQPREVERVPARDLHEHLKVAGDDGQRVLGRLHEWQAEALAFGRRDQSGRSLV